MGRAQRLRRDDELAPRQRQRRRARHPHEGGNAEHAENAGEIEDRLPEIGGDRERQDQGGKASSTSMLPTTSDSKRPRK